MFFVLFFFFTKNSLQPKPAKVNHTGKVSGRRTKTVTKTNKLNNIPRRSANKVIFLQVFYCKWSPFLLLIIITSFHFMALIIIADLNKTVFRIKRSVLLDICVNNNNKKIIYLCINTLACLYISAPYTIVNLNSFSCHPLWIIQPSLPTVSQISRRCDGSSQLLFPPRC